SSLRWELYRSLRWELSRCSVAMGARPLPLLAMGAQPLPRRWELGHCLRDGGSVAASAMGACCCSTKAVRVLPPWEHWRCPFCDGSLTAPPCDGSAATPLCCDRSAAAALRWGHCHSSAVGARRLLCYDGGAAAALLRWERCRSSAVRARPLLCGDGGAAAPFL
ncbi:unnamed protein product, partial [Musa textilis]